MKQLSLDEVWDKQQSYNTLIRQQHPNKDVVDWMINYVLGAHSELSDLLAQTNWRNNSTYVNTDFGPNVIEELTDVTKYIFSLWQLMGCSPQDMLNSMALKGELLNQILYQETRPQLKKRSIIMLDLDGVVADFRTGFMEWVSNTKWAEILTIKEEEIGLHMDINHGWDYNAYNQAKIEFEREGGYSFLPSIKAVKMAVNTLKSIGWYIMVYTARPYTAYKRIWGDTYLWLKDHDIQVDELHFGYDERVLTASYLQNDNHVVALEDDPTLIKRYQGCNIPVFVYPQPYNISVYFNSDSIKMLDPHDTHWQISNLIHATLEMPDAQQR